MLERVSRLAGTGRTIAVGSVAAVAVVGLGLSSIAADAFGGERPVVEPIVIDALDGDGELQVGDARGGASRSPSSDDDGDGGVDGSRSVSDPAGIRPGISSGSDLSSPVPTAPPPAPRTAATAGATVEHEEDDATGYEDPVEPATTDGRDDPEDDD